LRIRRKLIAGLGIACLFATLAPVGGGAQAAEPPNISAIDATFSFPVTTYGVLATDPDGDSITYRWEKTKERDCGTLTGANTDTFKWSHPHPPCPNEDFHPGTITVTVSDGTFNCKAVYPNGSREGIGPEPEPCTSVSDPVSVFCPGFQANEGWFEPTQGVWQDDDYWRDRSGKQLTRVNPKSYVAELDMVRNRPTVLMGIDHAVGEAKHRHERDQIVMRGVTTGSKKVPVKMRFSVTDSSGTQEIYTTPNLTRLPLLKPCGKRQRFRINLRTRTGVPRASTFTFNGSGPYTLENELIRGDTNDGTGMKVQVFGNVVETSFPTTSFLGTTLSTTDQAGSDSLLANAVRLANETSTRLPDYLPLPSGGVNTLVYPIVFHAETTLETGRQNWLAWAESNPSAPVTARELRIFRDQALAATAASYFAVFAHLGRAGRMVVLLNDADLERINPWPFNINGLATSEKVVLVQDDESHITVMHELVHTIPHVFLDDGQQPCGPPNYHNRELNTANGLQLTVAGQPTRKRWNGARSFLEVNDRTNLWIDQCTYWHLLGRLQAPIDPPVILVRGRIALPESGPIGELLPSYEIAEGEADLTTSSKGRYAIVLRDSAGAELARYRFNPSFHYGTHPVRKLSLVSFSTRIPDMDGIATIELVGPNGVLLHTLASSANAPSVRIAAPRNNSTVSATDGAVEVSWTGSDQDGGSLLYSVLYSYDGGTNWIPQVFETNATSAMVQVSGDEHMVKVVATDGAHSGEAVVEFETR